MESCVTILILVDGFLQCNKQICYACSINSHNPYFSRWFSAIDDLRTVVFMAHGVTILILVDGFLQFSTRMMVGDGYMRHNPYFSRWFSAMKIF